MVLVLVLRHFRLVEYNRDFIMSSENAYTLAQKALSDAIEYLPLGGALPDEGDPIPYAQVCATVGVGQAILALCEELHEQWSRS
jgi:hypothetical protein